jgi:hypothetical protein
MHNESVSLVSMANFSCLQERSLGPLKRGLDVNCCLNQAEVRFGSSSVLTSAVPFHVLQQRQTYTETARNVGWFVLQTEG